MNIPLVDLKIQYKVLKKDIDSAIQCVLEEANFLNSDQVTEFEKELAIKNEIKHCIGVDNETDALYITLKMLGVEYGDEIIVSASSNITISNAIILTGANPVFIDCNDYYNINIQNIESKITDNTIAIIASHQYGQVCEIEAIRKITNNYNLYLIEDCTQAVFAEYNRLKVGTFGDAGIISFSPDKNLGAYGNSGAILTDDDDLAEKTRMYANNGAIKKDKFKIEGIDSRIDSIQAAVLKVKLQYIKQWNDMRQKNSEYLIEKLFGIGDLILPSINENASHVYNSFVIRTKKRDELAEFLNKNGIATSCNKDFFPAFTEAYSHLNYKPEDLEQSALCKKEILALPIYPELKIDMMNYIASTINTFFKK